MSKNNLLDSTFQTTGDWDSTAATRMLEEVLNRSKSGEPVIEVQAHQFVPLNNDSLASIYYPRLEVKHVQPFIKPDTHNYAGEGLGAFVGAMFGYKAGLILSDGSKPLAIVGGAVGFFVGNRIGEWVDDHWLSPPSSNYYDLKKSQR